MPATDDHDRGHRLDVLWDSATPGDSARVSAVELEVVEEEPGKTTGHWLTAEKRHHLPQELMRQRVRHAAAVAVGADRRQSQSTHLRPLVCWDAALYVQRQRGIARHVHEGAQERGDAHVL